mmetsp:Transcript_49459/g.150520  ORF Transcript_49459/g.150520 Transcript_49459/m.150520 type:complete len:172 (-) Transcript_49459:23-538(-)
MFAKYCRRARVGHPAPLLTNPSIGVSVVVAFTHIFAFAICTFFHFLEAQNLMSSPLCENLSMWWLNYIVLVSVAMGGVLSLTLASIDALTDLSWLLAGLVALGSIAAEGAVLIIKAFHVVELQKANCLRHSLPSRIVFGVTLLLVCGLKLVCFAAIVPHMALQLKRLSRIP